MFTKYKTHFLIIFLAILASLLVLAGAFMLAPETAHADTEETHDHSEMTELTARPDDGNLTAGTYYLDADITGNVTVTGTVTLCLNGHNIVGDGSSAVIDLYGTATFTLCDCVGTGCVTGGTMGVYINIYGSTFNMYGGTISGNASGGVFIDSNPTFNMYGGTISGNTTNDRGAGVYVAGKFNMSGGTISGNTANYTYIEGGGVYVSGAYAKFNISGTPVITGNKKVGAEKNVVLNNLITVTGTLEEGAKIGVFNTGEVATGFTQEGNPADYFIPDNPANNCVYVSNKTSGTVTIAAHTGGTATCSQLAVCENCGTEFGDFGDHSFTAWAHDETNHWHICANCGESQNDEAAHSGTDDGDCTTAVTCICGYVITAAFSHHIYSAGHTYDENQHWKVCLNTGCTQLFEKGNHIGTDDGDCTTRLFCGICGYTIKAAESEHNYSATWTTDENQHWKVCLNTDCTQNDTKENHSGTATCTEKAVCSTCGNEYGEIDPDNHNFATAWSHGDTTHWHECENCGYDNDDEEAHTFAGGNVPFVNTTRQIYSGQ